MQVLNKKVVGVPAGAKYIGRGSPWGNPYVMRGEADRVNCVMRFEGYAKARLAREPNWLDPLIGFDLVCFCAPRWCHGHVLRRLIMEIVRRREAASPRFVCTAV